MTKIVLLHKPFGVLSQFTTEEGHRTLKELVPIPDIYPAGRLDKDSEGLLILTDNGQLQHEIAHPKRNTGKTYWAQVEGIISDKECEKLASGIHLKDGLTKPVKCRPIAEPKLLEARTPPIRVRKNIPDSWCELTLFEGKNRQVRRMCAAVGFPVLRLIRYRVGEWTIDGIKQGQYKLIPEG